jgi:acyl-CoA thioester hydrolase
MHDNVSGAVVAAFVTRLDVHDIALDPQPEVVEVPEFARPRGLIPDRLPPPPATREQARHAGFRIVGRGVIGDDECDADGRLLPQGYIGRVSDGMPNLWALLNPPAEQQAHGGGELGGAALEQRLVILEPMARGSVFAQLSGVRMLGNKTQQMAHVLFDESRDRVAATVEAVGVAMDLTTRKAVTISADRRAHLESLRLR